MNNKGDLKKYSALYGKVSYLKKTVILVLFLLTLVVIFIINSKLDYEYFMFSNSKGSITKKFNSKFKGILKIFDLKSKDLREASINSMPLKSLVIKTQKKDIKKCKSKQEEQYVQKYSRCPSKEIKKTKEEIT